MVTKGWFRVSIGVILLSASMVSIFFNRSMNSRRSAFSTNMSLPSKSVVMFTWREIGTGHQNPAVPPPSPNRPYSLFATLSPSHSLPFLIPRRVSVQGSCHLHGPSLTIGCGCSLSREGRGRPRAQAATGTQKHAGVTGCALFLLPSAELKCTSHYTSLKIIPRWKDFWALAA